MKEKTMQRKGWSIGFILWFFVFLSLTISGCDSCSGGGGGGGGGGGTPLPPPVNHAPVITSIPGTSVVALGLYEYTVIATDADGDTLNYSFEVSPVNMNIDAASGYSFWSPLIGQVGDHTVKVKVSDGETATYQEYIITVTLPANQPPEFTTTPVITAIVGELYIYDANATDADGDPLTFSLTTSPSGMTIDSVTGEAKWTPGIGQVGEHFVQVTVSDGKGSGSQLYKVTVSLPPPNTAPVFTSEPVRSAIANLPYVSTAHAFDLDGDPLTYGLKLAPAGMSIGSASGQINWTPVLGDVGNHWIEVTVTDGETTVSQPYAIRVIAADNGVPNINGCTLTSWWWTDYQSTLVENTLLQMHYDGCQVVFILITWYQDSISSTTIYSRVQKSPTDAGIAHVTNYAHSLGMKVYFKPHVDIPSGTWRGYITFTNEADWLAWFASYDAFMTYYLNMAETLGVDGFVIGTELVGTEQRVANWRNTVALGRSKFSGLITYCANHDSYAAITWWDALDFISLSAYFQLTGSYTPTVPQLVAAWVPWKNNLSAFAATWNMDIVFVEIGYQSYNGTNISPWWAPTGTVDLQEQADCYEAAFQALFTEHWFKGMSWWMWYWDPSQNVNGFDIYNKPAEDTLRWWFAGY